MTTTQPTIAELAQWPTSEDAVTVANVRRTLLVWAKVYECRLWDDAGSILSPSRTSESAQRSIDLIASYQHNVLAAVLLDQLNSFDPDAALEQARRYWRACDDGEMFADILLAKLDSIDPELAEAVASAFEATPKPAPAPAPVGDDMTAMLHDSLGDGQQLLAALATDPDEPGHCDDPNCHDCAATT